MWFVEDMKDVYTDEFERLIFMSGYDPLRVDQVEHVRKIDEEIVAQIDALRIIVADFTGQRRGVYFEAGYAPGRDLPVFWTCRKAHM